MGYTLCTIGLHNLAFLWPLHMERIKNTHKKKSIKKTLSWLPRFGYYEIKYEYQIYYVVVVPCNKNGGPSLRTLHGFISLLNLLNKSWFYHHYLEQLICIFLDKVLSRKSYYKGVFGFLWKNILFQIKYPVKKTLFFFMKFEKKLSKTYFFRN